VNPDYIALVRSGLGRSTAGLPALVREGAERASAALVFLHGAGVEWAGEHLAEWTLEQPHRCVVCTTSWRRRFGDVSPPEPIRVATLSVLLEALADARRVDSFTDGVALCSTRVGGRSVLLEIDRPPIDDRDARETLEVVLGAAALELPARVLITAAGAGHLIGESRRRWRQVTDLALLPVHVEASGSGEDADSGVARERSRAAQRVLI
jgi:hypothetical protein